MPGSVARACCTIAVAVAAAGCAGPDAWPGEQTLALEAAPECRTVTLVAAKRYSPTVWYDAAEELATPMAFAIPASIPVTRGNAGNHTATLRFDDGGLVTCTYRGTGTTPIPTTPAQIAAAQSYGFVGCDSHAAAGDVATTVRLMLHVVQGGNYIYPGQTTEVRLTLDEQGDCCSPADPPTWFEDLDGDGFGDPGRTLAACAPPPGYVDRGGDCNDNDAATYPGAPEVCDGADNDCDGAIDDGVVTVWYLDDDADGYGDPAAAAASCTRPARHVANGLDCDDTDDAISPAAAEFCDGRDNDCDGAVDDGAVDATEWYTDADVDGFGDPAAPVFACEQPAGAVVNDDDCDDGSGAVWPGAPEACNGVDDDCDAVIDEGC